MDYRCAEMRADGFSGAKLNDMAKEIILNKGMRAIVDDEDFDRVTNKGKWYINNTGHVRMGLYMGTRSNGKIILKNLQLHRFIIDAPDGMEVDHINGNALDNRKQNLRVCTKSQNMMNRGAQKNNTSGFKGVYWNARKDKWMVTIGLNSKYIFIGYFSCKIEAAQAYNKAALKYHGEFAKINQIS